MISEATMAKRPRARANFSTVLARADITRTQLAAAAGVSPRTIDSLANPSGYKREGHTREITAWRIAKGFAKLTNQSDEAAYDALFIEEGEADNA